MENLFIVEITIKRSGMDKILNGALPTGTYFYIITTSDKKQKTGSVYINR